MVWLRTEQCFLYRSVSCSWMYYTRLQSKNNLQKAHNGWLLPLQMHMGGIAAANKNDIDQHAVDTVCALNPNSGGSCVDLVSISSQTGNPQP
ncbi:hypothetical protein V6Z12_A08G050300 [Gossypium hirsutum]